MMRTLSLKRDGIFLLVLFCLSFVIRFYVFETYLGKNNNYWQIDSANYNDIAVSLVHGKGFAFSDGSPEFYRLPLYPLFIAACYKLLGENPVHVVWVQLVLASLIPLLIFFLCIILFPQQQLARYIASVMGALHFGLVFYASFFMTETLFIIFLLLFFILFFASLHLFFCPVDVFTGSPQAATYLYDYCPDPACTSQWYLDFSANVFDEKVLEESATMHWKFFLAGILLGAASLVRAVGPFCVILALIICAFSKGVIVEKLRNTFLFLVGWCAVIAPWIIRNYVLTGSLFFHTLPGGHFLYLSAARVVMFMDNSSYQEACDKLGKRVQSLVEKEVEKKGRPLTPVENCIVREKLAISCFLSHPFYAVRNWLTDIMRTSLSLYSAEIVYLEGGRTKFDYFNKTRTIWSMFKRYLFPETSARVRLLVWSEILFFILIVFGFLVQVIGWLRECLRDFYTDLSCRMFLVLPWIALFILLACSGGYCRMRLPIEPLILIISACGWASLFVRRKALV